MCRNFSVAICTNTFDSNKGGNNATYTFIQRFKDIQNLFYNHAAMCIFFVIIEYYIIFK
jgi:hypothetical protein